MWRIGLIAYNPKSRKYEIFDSLHDFSQETEDYEQAKVWAKELIENYDSGLQENE